MDAGRFLIAGVTLLCLTGCESPQPTNYRQTAIERHNPVTLQRLGEYAQTASGMKFPPRVGGFGRDNIVQFDKAGEDVAVGYVLGSGPSLVVVTVYVYPAPALTTTGPEPVVILAARAIACGREFERRKKELLTVHPDARLLREGAARPQLTDALIPGSMANYQFEEAFAGQKRSVNSELELFCYVGGKWTIKYRVTSTNPDDTENAVRTFMTDLPWTVTPEQN